MSPFIQSFFKYLPAFARLAIYAIITGLSTYYALISAKTAEQIAAMTFYDWQLVLIQVAIPVCVVIRSFLDGTMSKINNPLNTPDVNKMISKP